MMRLGIWLSLPGVSAIPTAMTMKRARPSRESLPDTGSISDRMAPGATLPITQRMMPATMEPHRQRANPTPRSHQSRLDRFARASTREAYLAGAADVVTSHLHRTTCQRRRAQEGHEFLQRRQEVVTLPHHNIEPLPKQRYET